MGECPAGEICRASQDSQHRRENLSVLKVRTSPNQINIVVRDVLLGFLVFAGSQCFDC